MKKITSILLPILIFAAIIVSMAKSFRLASYILGILLIMCIAILFRNILIPKKIFDYRFYWYYPSLIFIALSFYKLFRIIIKNEELRMFDFHLIGGITLGLGLIWGIREKFRLKKNNHESILAERIDLLTEDVENIDKRGTLLLTKKNELIFISKDKTELKIDTSDIQNTSLKNIAGLFPIYIKIELKTGKEYIIGSDFPLIWQKALTI
ncbi:MAG: hypothetical protein ACI7YS_18215 [Flavobacterium sp.]